MRLPRSTRGFLATVAIALAVALLGALILLSTSPAQEAHRRLDAALAYLQTATESLSSSLSAGARQQVDVGEDLSQLAAGIAEVGGGLGDAYRTLYAPTETLDQTRNRLMHWYAGDAPDGAHAELFERQKSQRDLLLKAVRASGPSQSQYVDAYRQLEAGVRDQVRDLRERGRNADADELFRAGQQLLERAARGADRDFIEIDQIIDRLFALGAGFSIRDREVLGELLDQARSLSNARQEINDLSNAMSLPAFARTLAELRELATDDYLAVLTYINEARILLNVYTALLVLVLGYFGVRLQRSYVALNRSHDDLEQRVQERTADLQSALSELKESQVQLVQAEKMSSLGQLVAGVMHEINTPLLYVLNNTTLTAEMVKDIGGYVDATLPIVKARNAVDAQEAMKTLLDQREYLGADLIEENLEEITTLATDSLDGLNQISELVQSLKDFSRLDRAQEDRFDVREGIEKTLLMTRNVLKYGVEVTTDFGEVAPIYCVPSRINQVFINLITNAAQAMEGEGTLTIATRQIKDWVEISFTDTGCGIEEENLNKILDPFFTTKPVGQGTGLGLSIVHKIIQEHGGQLLIDSQVGVGTRMTVGLPVNGRPADRGADDEKSEEAA